MVTNFRFYFIYCHTVILFNNKLNWCYSYCYTFLFTDFFSQLLLVVVLEIVNQLNRILGDCITLENCRYHLRVKINETCLLHEIESTQNSSLSNFEGILNHLFYFSFEIKSSDDWVLCFSQKNAQLNHDSVPLVLVIYQLPVHGWYIFWAFKVVQRTLFLLLILADA